MRQAASSAQQARKKATLVAGLGAAFVASGITVAVLASHPPSSATPVQTAEPAKVCQAAPLMELASTETGSGTVRFREGDYLSPPVKLSTSPQPVLFPRLRPQTAPLVETIIVEGNATDLVLGGEGDHFVVPYVNGTYSYTIRWLPKKC